MEVQVGLKKRDGNGSQEAKGNEEDSEERLLVHKWKGKASKREKKG